MVDEIYVIYQNGTRYDKSGRKIAYLTKGSAKSVVTSEASQIAKLRFEEVWYDLPREEREIKIEEVKKEFEIVVYVPKEENR